jgi:uncharacterized protein (UPF0332 family)
MTEETELHFQRAAECVEDSQVLLDNERPAASVGRAYYAMFHAATAVLADISHRSDYVDSFSNGMRNGLKT